MKNSPIKVGTMLTLILKRTGNKTELYHSKVIDFQENYLLIDYPIDQKTKKTKYLPNGTLLTANFVGEDQAVYEFETKITARIKLNIPAIAIQMPKQEETLRIQRREFVRIETTVDIAVHRKTDKGDGFTTVTADISGGGLSFILPQDEELFIDEIIDIWIVLDFQSGEYHYIHAASQIVVNKEENGIQLCAVKFINLTAQEQQIIIRFCFEKQREMRKKELS